MTADGRFRILAVCTGNICRSPMMERFLLARLRTDHGQQATDTYIEVSSAGTWGYAGSPMDPYADQCLRERNAGDDVDTFRGRELTADIVRQADLVLTAERAHRKAVVELDPKAAQRTFTLREFARLLSRAAPDDVTGDTLADRWHSLTALARGNRGLVPVDDPAADDIADPYKRPQPAFDDAADQIEQALAVPLRLLAPHRGPASP